MSGGRQDAGCGEGLLVVLSGPSGVGKDAVAAALRETHPDLFIAVTATTRPKRPGEVDGRDYIFLSKEQFEDLVKRDEFLEHAEVYGRRYGVPKDQVRRALVAGRDVVMKVDVQGAATIRRAAPGGLLIFLAPPDMSELERRLRSRKTESTDQLALRIETARREMEEAAWFDRVIVNETDAVRNTVDRIVSIMESERRRVPPRKAAL